MKTMLTDAPEQTNRPAPAEVREQVSTLNKDLETAAGKFGRYQNAVAAQQQLETLLKQGRVHLQELRKRLLEMTAERDALQMKLGDMAAAHQVELERLSSEIDARNAAEQQLAAERVEDRATFDRQLAEAHANHRDLVQELDEQRQQNNILRQAAIRAQDLARQIISAQEPVIPNDEG